MDESSLEDSAVHLTNAAVQKKDPSYSLMKEFQIQPPEALAVMCEQQGNLASADYLRTKVNDDIKRCMKDVLKVLSELK
jgi:hypothetical protein